MSLSTLSFSIRDAARQCPNRVGLVHGEKAWTFQELLVEVQPYLQPLDDHLRASQEDPPPWIALLGSPQPSTLFALYALLERRIPVVLLHPRWTQKERDERLEESPATGVLDPPTKSLAPSETRQIDVPTKSLAPSWATSKAAVEVPLAMVFTSGSGGHPKGVILSRRAFLASAAASAENLGWRDDDRWLLSMPIAHVGGLSIVTRCLAARRCVVLSEHDRFTATGFAEEIERRRITLASLVPTMLHRLLSATPPWTPPPHLRALLLGGAGAPRELLAEAADRGVPVLTTYGLTEACSQVTTQGYQALQHGTLNRGQLGTGAPLPGIEVRTQGGEIQVRGPTLMDGYHPLTTGKPPFREGGWFPTGDLGSLDEAGNLHVHGRKGDRIITGGENVDPAEVEAALLLHPSIREACVFGLDDPEWGQRVCAALVTNANESLEARELRAFLDPRLATYKQPKSFAFVDELPLLPSGKIDRRAMARSFSTMSFSTLKATGG